MAQSTSPHDDSGVFATLQELIAEFDFDEDGQVIDDLLLSSVGTSLAVPGVSPRLEGGGLSSFPAGSSSTGESEGEALPFAAEIDNLRIALQRLQHAFSCTTSIEEHHKLASAISLITASISRLVRAQNHLASKQVTEINREIRAALDIVMKEWSNA